MKRIGRVILSSALLASVAGFAFASPTPTPTITKPITVAKCRFERELPKGEGDTECFAVVTFVGNPASGTRPVAPFQLLLKCDDEVVYKGDAVLESVNIGPESGVTLITAEHGPDRTFPAIWVDSDVTVSPARDVDARLKFDEDDLIRGTCDGLSAN